MKSLKAFKKIVSLMLVVVMVIAFTACGSKKGTSGDISSLGSESASGEKNGWWNNYNDDTDRT